MKRFLVWAIPLLVLLALVGWRFKVQGGATTPAQTRPGGPLKAAPVEVSTALPQKIVQKVESVGSVESPFKVEISPKIAGRISYLTVREGDHVTPGEVLLKVDPSDLQGALVQAVANVAQAKSRYAQAEVTSGANEAGISTQISQQSAGVAGAAADLDQAEKNFQSQIEGAQAQVDSADQAVKVAEANLEKEQATLQNVKTKLERTKSLYTQGFTAAQDLDDAKTALGVQEGSVKVAQGQLLSAQFQLKAQNQNLIIARRKGQADIAASKARMAQAKAGMDMASANRSQSPAFKQNLEALKSAVDAAEAQEAQAKSKLLDTVYRSTIAGTVTSRKADPGALGTPGTPVLEVQFLDWVYVTASLPVEAGNQIHLGQEAKINFDAIPNRKFIGKIVSINPAVDPQSHQFGIKVRLDNQAHAVLPGMYARIAIKTGEVNASVVVPREAVNYSQENGRASVVVARPDETADVRAVLTGASDDQGTAILSGVRAGERVVILSYTELKSGQKLILGLKKPSKK